MKYTINLKHVKTKRGFHRAVKKGLSRDYGANFDALHDILTELPDDTLITWTNTKAMEQSLPDALETLHTMCEDIHDEYPGITFIFE